MLYTYILQEKNEDFWLDKSMSNERKFIEQLLKVYRQKYGDKLYRVVRLLQ